MNLKNEGNAFELRSLRLKLLLIVNVPLFFIRAYNPG